MTVIARSLGHCTAHTAYEHDCPFCRDAELQVARWSDVKTDEALATTLRGAVEALRQIVLHADMPAGEPWERAYVEVTSMAREAFDAFGGQ